MLNLNCYICFNQKLKKVLCLGDHPPPLNFLTREQLDSKEERSFPLNLVFCPSCGLVQLDDAIDPKIMFEKYTYTSGASNAFKNHLHSFAKHLVEKFQLKEGDLVIDIASNDGTLLEGFLPYKIKVLGVEPSDVSKIAISKGVETVNDFFNEQVAKKILEKYGKAKIITATNVFAHVKHLDSFVKGMKILLDSSGSFVSESHYLMDLIEKLEYDTIYHEHLRYYGLKQLKKLFENYEMEIFDVERIPTHGGSIRVFASYCDKFPISTEVKKMINQEEELGLSDRKIINDFAIRVQNNKNDLRRLLLGLKSEGKRIVGVSAPARSNTILNYCEIDSSILDYITEKSSLKIGKFTPGSHIKVEDDELLVKEQPDYALLLSWHLADSIIPKLKNDGYKGKFIVPLPVPKIL